jgi:hypothetical protein
LTHGHPNALAASIVLGTAVALPVDGAPAYTIAKRLLQLATPIRRICGGGDLIFDNLSPASSVVTGLVLALTHPDLPACLHCLLRRRRSRWDLDSTAAVYAALAGALRPGGVPRDLTVQVEGDMQCDFRRVIGRVLHRQAAVRLRLPP